MSVITKQSSADRVIIRNVRWATYENQLKDLENRSAPRLAYDHGVLEIMSPHAEHEEVNRTLAARLVASNSAANPHTTRRYRPTGEILDIAGPLK